MEYNKGPLNDALRECGDAFRDFLRVVGMETGITRLCWCLIPKLDRIVSMFRCRSKKRKGE